jgi:hypothetical protein
LDQENSVGAGSSDSLIQAVQAFFREIWEMGSAATNELKSSYQMLLWKQATAVLSKYI